MQVYSLENQYTYYYYDPNIFHRILTAKAISVFSAHPITWNWQQIDEQTFKFTDDIINPKLHAELFHLDNFINSSKSTVYAMLTVPRAAILHQYLYGAATSMVDLDENRISALTQITISTPPTPEIAELLQLLTSNSYNPDGATKEDLVIVDFAAPNVGATLVIKGTTTPQVDPISIIPHFEVVSQTDLIGLFISGYLNYTALTMHKDFAVDTVRVRTLVQLLFGNIFDNVLTGTAQIRFIDRVHAQTLSRDISLRDAMVAIEDYITTLTTTYDINVHSSNEEMREYNSNYIALLAATAGLLRFVTHRTANHVLEINTPQGLLVIDNEIVSSYVPGTSLVQYLRRVNPVYRAIHDKIVSESNTMEYRKNWYLHVLSGITALPTLYVPYPYTIII